MCSFLLTDNRIEAAQIVYFMLGFYGPLEAPPHIFGMLCMEMDILTSSCIYNSLLQLVYFLLHYPLPQEVVARRRAVKVYAEHCSGKNF